MSAPETVEDVEEIDRPADARDDDSAALANFIAKWRVRWPEWSIAETFVAADQRKHALAWATLQQELTDAAWGGSDPIPGVAKLGWWQEELSGWTRGARRHPIATVLQAVPAPWQALANALPALSDSRERASNVADAFDAVEPFATAVAAVDHALFGCEPAADDLRVVAASLLQLRMLQEGDAHVPMDMLARAGSGDPVATWAAELSRQWPRGQASSRVRRLWAALAQKRLHAATPAKPMPGWKTLWTAWRAAQG